MQLRDSFSKLSLRKGNIYIIGSRFTVQAQNAWDVGPMSPIQ